MAACDVDAAVRGEKDGGDDDVAMYDWPDLKKRSPYGLGCTQNRGQRGIKFKKKKKPIWPRVERKTEAEGDSMASVLNRGKKLRPFGLAPICFGSRVGAEY